jgi:hypothetical protein
MATTIAVWLSKVKMRMGPAKSPSPTPVAV